MNADENFEKISQEMVTKLLDKNPEMATFLGLHDPYDQIWPKGSADRYFENVELFEEWLRRLSSNIKREEISDDHKIDWEAIEHSKEDWKFFVYEQRMYELNPDAFDEIGGAIFLMFSRDYAPLEKRTNDISARVEKLPKYLEEFHARFEKSQPVRLWTEIAVEKAQGISGLFQFILYTVKGKVSDKIFERLSNAVTKLEPALEAHMRWLQGLLPRTKEDWALGREKFEKLLKVRKLGLSSDEILRIGIKYLADLKVEREKIAKQIASGKTVEEVMKDVESKAPETFEDGLEFTRKTMEDAKRFIQEKNIATVYSEDVLLVKETPAFMTPVIPFAAMMMSAKFDKPQIGIYIVTRPKDAANLGKHLNYASVKNTAVHEAFPGHFLQGAISNRGSIARLLPQGNETVEGWAHYCEQMMYEKGFIADLETRLMQVNDVIWRAVRIIVDVKLSRGEMGFEEAVEMLMKEAAMSREAAVAEVKRYTQTPGYPLSYLLGKHLILKLKEEIKAKMGNRFDDKFFHDTITANGYLPVSLLRRVFDQKISNVKAS